MPEAVHAVLMVLGLALCVLAWAPGLSAPYQYDDFVTPVKDPASQSVSAWADAVPRTLRPLTKLTFAVESSLGLNSAPMRRGFQLIAFVLVVVVFAVLAWLAGVSPTVAIALGTVWGVHPANAELLLALAGRSVLLALLLTLLSAVLLLLRRHPWAVAVALLAVLARETAWAWLVACAALSAHDRGASRARVVATVAASTMVGAALVLSSQRLRQLLASTYSDGAVFDRLGLQWAAVPRGLWLWLTTPQAFTVDMDPSAHGLARLGAILVAVAMYVSAAVVVLRAKTPRGLRVVVLLWLAVVVPLHSIVPKLDPLTARNVACSAAATLLIAATAGAGALQPSRRLRVALSLVTVVVIIAGVATTRARARLYQDPIALWRDAADHSIETARPFINLGTLLAQDGRLNEAKAVLEEGLRHNAQSAELRARLDAVEVLIETRNLLTRPDGRESLVDDEAHAP